MTRDILEGANNIDEDYWIIYQKWQPWIVEYFLPSIHYKYGMFEHLPFAGGIAQQPAITMRILKIIQYEYLQHLNRVKK